MYRVGQNVHSGFAMRWYGKPEWMFLPAQYKGKGMNSPWWGWRLQKQVVNRCWTEEIPWNQQNLRLLGWDIKLDKNPSWADWGSSASPGFDLPWVDGCCYSVAQSYHTLCDPMDCSMPGFPVLHCSQELAVGTPECSLSGQWQSWSGLSFNGGFERCM